MQKWFSSRPKGVRILLWWMTGTAAVFLLAVLGFSIAAWEWFPAAPLFIIVWIWPLALSLLLCMQFAVWCLEIRHGRIPGESAADRFCAVLSFVFAVLGVFLCLFWVYLHQADAPALPEEYSSLLFSGQIQEMSMAAAGLALLPLGMDFLHRKLAVRFSLCRRKGWHTGRRILCVLLCCAVLLVPNPGGSYNDGGEDGGGSAIYEAVLYDAVRWNRTHYFDGTPFPTEAQRLRIYFFPYNCYTYEDRWELKH